MKPETLKRELKKVEWHKIEDDFTMPCAQGTLLNALLKEYFVGKCKVLEIGWTLDMVAVKTTKQIIAWKDTGIGARFLGIVNNDGTVEQHSDDKKGVKEETFKTMAGLRKEIHKRKYDGIKGLKATITKEEYDYFLNVLPPFKYTKNGFILSEALSDQLYYEFKQIGKKYYAEVVKLEDEEVMKIEMAQ